MLFTARNHPVNKVPFSSYEIVELFSSNSMPGPSDWIYFLYRWSTCGLEFIIDTCNPKNLAAMTEDGFLVRHFSFDKTYYDADKYISYYDKFL